MIITRNIQIQSMCIGRALLVALLLLLVPRDLSAHAVLTSSEPAENARVLATPAQVRLVFSEPLEPAFSRIALYDAGGQLIATDVAHVDPDDAYALILPLSEQPDGLYSVRWSVVSAADGHGTQGTVNFVIGSAPSGASDPEAQGSESTSAARAPSPWSAFVRWFNLVALSLLVGSAAFAAWVMPASTDGSTAQRRVGRLFAVAWAMTGVALVLLLLLQTQQMVGAAPGENPAAQLGTVVTHSRFGQLWGARVVVWLTMGAVAWFAFRRYKGYGWVVIAGLLLLLLHSAQSHAAAAPIPLAAILADWLHLTLTTFWVGGLAALVVALPFQRGKWSLRVPVIVAFSNFARLLVLGLFLTGIYAAWLQVGSLGALLDTPYGNALLVKLLLMLPLLAIAASNWLLTHRSQRAGRDYWQGSLRGFLVAEIVLLLGVLGAVGVMTSTMPARTAESEQMLVRAQAIAEREQPYLALEQVADDLHLHLVITPGFVGENEFALTVHDLANHLPVVDISLIRLRFENSGEGGGESELRIESGEHGTYRGAGVNLNAPGDWRIRTTVQRPDEFDAVTDFTVTVVAPPPVEPVVIESSAIPQIALYAATMTLALLLLGIGGYLLGLGDVRLRSGEGGVALLFLLAGALLFVGAALA